MSWSGGGGSSESDDIGGLGRLQTNPVQSATGSPSPRVDHGGDGVVTTSTSSPRGGAAGGDNADGAFRFEDFGLPLEETGIASWDCTCGVTANDGTVPRSPKANKKKKKKKKGADDAPSHPSSAPIDGTAFLTRRFLAFGWPGADPAEAVVVTLCEVEDVSRAKVSRLNRKAVLSLRTAGLVYTLRGIARTDECQVLIEHFWPAAVQEEEELARIRAQGAAQGGRSDDTGTPSERRAELMRSGEHQGEADDLPPERATQRLIRIANETREVGAVTLARLSEQGDQIRRTHVKVQRIHAELDRSARLLRNMKSLGGALKNRVTKDTTGAISRETFDKLEELIHAGDIDVPIVRINNRGKHQKRLLRLTRTGMQRIGPKGKEPNVEYTDVRKEWSYESLSKCVVHAQPEHVTMRFLKGEAPLTFVTAYVDVITATLDERLAHAIDFVAEDDGRTAPGTLTPESGRFYLEAIKAAGNNGASSAPSRPTADPRQERAALLDGRTRTPGGTAVAWGTATPAGSASGSAPGANQGERTPAAMAALQERMRAEDEDLDQVSNIVGDLRNMALDMGREIDRQNSLLDDLATDVDDANERLKDQNKEMIRILK